MAIPTPFAYWKLDEVSGNRADSVGSETLVDNNTVGSAAGKIGNASEHIRANNEFLSNTTVLSSIGNAWTFSAWFNFPQIGSADQTVISCRPSSGSANLIQIECNINIGQLRAIVFNSSGTYVKDYRFPGGLTANTWAHCVFTWDGTTLTFYLNGSTSGVSKAVDSALTMTATSRTLRIGAEVSSSNVADGLIDEVGLWNVALTSGEVSELYNGGAGVTYPFTTATPPRLMMMGVGT